MLKAAPYFVTAASAACLALGGVGACVVLALFVPGLTAVGRWWPAT